MKNRVLMVLAYILFLCGVYPAHSAERLKVGLALSGGGSRGAAHIGVLRELERQRIPIDYIAGTSVGSIIGALYAAGKTVEEIERIITDSNIDQIFEDKQSRKDISLRRKQDRRLFQLDKQLGVKIGEQGSGGVQLPSGLKQGQKLTLFLDKLFLSVTDISDFDDLPIPYRAIATDIVTSEAVVLGSGNITTAVRASMSIPTVFSVVEYQGRILVDGGISNNLPIDVVREMGADVVIAVDIGSQLIGQKKLTSAVGISLQLSNILVKRTTREQIKTLGEGDVLIQPDLGDFSALNFKDSASIIPQGEAATHQLLKELSPLRLSEGRYIHHVSTRIEDSAGLAPKIYFVEVSNNSKLNDAFILAKVHQIEGERLDFDTLEQDISTLHGMGIFKSVNYEVVTRDGQTGLIIKAEQKPWGPNYLEFGFSYSSDLSSDNNLALALGYTVTPTNGRNGEWRSIIRLGKEHAFYTEYHQPLAVNSAYFVNGALSASSRIFNEFENGKKVSISRVDELRVAASFGREFGNWSEVRLGLNQFTSDASTETGQDSVAVSDVRGGEVFARFRSDTMNDTFFPTSGMTSLVRWVDSRAELGADNEFKKGLVDVLGLTTVNERNSFFLGARVGVTYSGTAPIQNGFRLGGLFNLPGYSLNELSGQNVYLLRTAYQRKLSRYFGTRPYLGASVQYGNISTDREQLDFSDGVSAISAWLGWKTIVGPVYLGYGYADTGDSAFYIEVGKHF